MKLIQELQQVIEQSELNEASLGSKQEFMSYQEWKNALPPKSTFVKDGNVERAQAISKDFEGVAGTWDKSKNSGWIYAHYLDKKNLREFAETTQEPIMENWAKKLAQANKDRAKKDKEERVALEKAQALAKKEQAAAAKAELIPKIASIIQREVSAVYPDADPFDFILPKVRKLGVAERDVLDLLNKACKEKLGAKSYDQYLSDFADDAGNVS
jgi:hypothetical protein